MRGTDLALGRWEKKKCEQVEARSGELHEHMIRKERERKSRRHQREKEGISMLAIWTSEQDKLRRQMIDGHLSR